MNFIEKKTIYYRLFAALVLLTNIALVVFSFITIFKTDSSNIVIALITVVFTGIIATSELIFIEKGWRKESYLYKIAFNDNKKINTAPLIAVSVGTILSVTLLILSLVIWFINVEPKNLVSALVIMVVSVYLFANCLIYYFYIILFKDRPINLRNFIK